MLYVKKLLYLFSPLLCVVLLFLALLISRREPAMQRAQLQEPERVRLLCDAQLQDPVMAILEAFQRRHFVQVDLIVATPKQLQFAGQSCPAGNILLTLKQMSDFYDCANTHVSSIDLATARLVVLVRSDFAGKIRNWSDLIHLRLRLALARNRDSTLGRHTSALLDSHSLSWEKALEQAVFRSDDGLALARTVALGKADAAILWEPNAQMYTQLASLVLLPVDDDAIATVSMLVLAPGTEKSGQLRLEQFLRGILAAEIFQQYNYGLPAAAAP